MPRTSATVPPDTPGTRSAEPMAKPRRKWAMRDGIETWSVSAQAVSSAVHVPLPRHTQTQQREIRIEHDGVGAMGNHDFCGATRGHDGHLARLQLVQEPIEEPIQQPGVSEIGRASCRERV